MATKLPLTAQAVISKCELCDLGNDARWFCTDCQEEMCLACKTTHLRMKATKHHQIIKTAAEDETQTTTQTQNKSLCLSHTRELVQMFCINCDLLVCHKCIAGEHKNHSFDTIPDTVDKYKEELSNCIKDTEQNINKLESSLSSLGANENNCLTLSDDAIDRVNSRRQELKSQIDTMADDIVQQLMNSKNCDLQAIRQQASEISTMISDHNDLLKKCKDTSQSQSDVSIIKSVTNIKSEFRQLKTCPMVSILVPPKFVCGKSTIMQDTFGCIENGKAVVQVSTDTSLSSNIDTSIIANNKEINRMHCNCLSTVDETLCWCGGLGESMALLNMEGKVLKEVNLGYKFKDIAMLSDGELLLADFYGCRIMKILTKEDKVVNVVDMSPYNTLGLCLTSEHDVLLCLNKKGEDNKVVRMDVNGQVKQTIQLNPKTGKELFTKPVLVTENMNKDICVIDDAFWKTFLVVLDKDGGFRFKYPEESCKTFRKCEGIVCDTYGNILLSDYYNHRIHRVDKDGHFIGYVLSSDYGLHYPCGMDIDKKGQLWLCNSGGLMVIKYRSS